MEPRSPCRSFFFRVWSTVVWQADSRHSSGSVPHVGLRARSNKSMLNTHSGARDRKPQTNRTRINIRKRTYATIYIMEPRSPCRSFFFRVWSTVVWQADSRHSSGCAGIGVFEGVCRRRSSAPVDSNESSIQACVRDAEAGTGCS